MRERTELEKALSDYVYTCGASLQDMELTGKLNEVYVRDVSCANPIEKLYYTAKYSTICVYCAIPVELDPKADHYPQCHSCVRPHITKDHV